MYNAHTHSFYILVLHVWLFEVGPLLLLAFASFPKNLTPCSCRISNVHSPESPSSRRVEEKHKILQRNEEDRPRNWKWLEIFGSPLGGVLPPESVRLRNFNRLGSSLQFTQAIFVAAIRCNSKIARVNQVRFSVRFVAAISQEFRTCLTLDAILLRKKLHRVAATKIACVNGPFDLELMPPRGVSYHLALLAEYLAGKKLSA